LPYFNAPFETHWAVIWIPALLAQLIAIVLFAVKFGQSLKLLLKHNDLNGDGLLKTLTNAAIIIFLALFLVAQLITVVRLSLPTNQRVQVNQAAALIPLPVRCCKTVVMFNFWF